MSAIQSDRNRAIGIIFLLLAAFLWSLGGVLIKSVTWHPLIASGFSFALMLISLRKQKNATPLASLILGNCLAAAVGLAFFRPPLPQPGEWLILAVLGIVQLGLPYFLLAYAIRHVTAMEACLIPMVEPILNPIWVLLLIGERPGPYAMLGGAVVLAAVATRAIIAVRHGRRFIPERIEPAGKEMFDSH